MKKLLLTVAVLLTCSMVYAQTKSEYRVKDGFVYVEIVYSDTWRVYNKAIVDGIESKAKLVDSDILIWTCEAKEVRRIKLNEVRPQEIVLKSRSGHTITINITKNDLMGAK